MLHTFQTNQWDENHTETSQQLAINKLESGQILHFPQLAFTLSAEEKFFLSPHYTDPHAKNISYNLHTKKIWGIRHLDDQQRHQLQAMLARYAEAALRLVKSILPQYITPLIIGRTSYRPVQISHRKTSFRKDDKRLHVDAFPSAPNQGKRILRVFCNINHVGEDRVWRVGESFERVAEHFLPQIRKPIPGMATLLRGLKVTKSYRTAYDHYMLRLHDSMKADDHYQKHAEQQEIRFKPGSSWIVQTDHVSHAAMQGQYVLEQTFYLPVTAMKNESLAPLRVLEKLLDKKLV